jgi:hypothetical protein
MGETPCGVLVRPCDAAEILSKEAQKWIILSKMETTWIILSKKTQDWIILSYIATNGKLITMAR